MAADTKRATYKLFKVLLQHSVGFKGKIHTKDFPLTTGHGLPITIYAIKILFFNELGNRRPPAKPSFDQIEIDSAKLTVGRNCR